MVTGKEWLRGGFDPVEQLKGLIALLEQHYAEAAGCPDPAIVAIIAGRIEGAARALADDAAA
jgi:hypothetical protein